VTKDMVKDGAWVIDVGINRLETGKVIGDVDFAGVSERVRAITPVPGGVGPMTIAMLLRNTAARGRAPGGERVSPDRKVLTVSELTTQLREVLEERFPAVWSRRNFELSPLRLGPRVLHAEGRRLAAARRALPGRGRRIRFEPADGLHVLAFGSIEVYPQRASTSWSSSCSSRRGSAPSSSPSSSSSPAAGRRLFDQARKRELPRFPRKIGIVTSTSGAAIQDMLRVIGGASASSPS